MSKTVHTVKRAVTRVKKAVVNRAKKVVSKVRTAAKAVVKKATKVVHAVKKVAKKTAKAVKSATKASATFVKRHAATITSVVVGAVVMAGCTAVTAGVGAVGCAALAGAAGGFAGSLVKARQTGHFSASDTIKETLIGGVLGAAIPGAGAGASRLARGVAGKVFSGGASRAERALADDLGNAGADVAGGSGTARAATDAPTSTGARPASTCPMLHSFAPSTGVLMGDGTAKAIGKIKVGDKVVAANTASGARSVRTVSRVFINHDKDLIDVKVLAGGKAAVIGTTAHHLFFDSSTGKWVAAGELKAGQKLSTVSPDVLTSVGTGSPPKVSDSRLARRVATGVLAAGLMVGVGAGAADAVTVPDAGKSVSTVAADIAVEGTTDRFAADGAARYDLTVEGDHTYYVIAGNTPVLVHNCGGSLGGRYGDLKPSGPGMEIHHMPADSISPLPRVSGPSIRMDAADHRLTASWGSGNAAKAYRGTQKALIDRGRMDDAIQMDINDIQARFGNKYDDHILQMIDSLPRRW